jgi:hypothetical protein
MRHTSKRTTHTGARTCIEPQTYECSRHALHVNNVTLPPATALRLASGSPRRRARIINARIAMHLLEGSPVMKRSEAMQHCDVKATSNQTRVISANYRVP